MTGPARHWPLAAALLCVALAWQPLFTGPAERFNTEVFGSAIRVYAILRSINAVISVAKETEIGVQLVGSVTTQPAMVLDPIDDTVARVADAVFALAAASGVLSIAFAPIAMIGGGIAAIGFALIWLPLIRPAFRDPLGAVGRSLAAFGLVLSLGLPLGYGLGGQLGAFWTEDARIEAQELLSGSAESLSSAVDQAQAAVTDAEGASGPLTPGAEASIWSRILDGAMDAGGAAGEAVRDAVPSMEAVQTRGGEILESSLTLIAIYIFRLIVLPVVLLWGLFLIARRMLG